jgi:hypothetical protein
MTSMMLMPLMKDWAIELSTAADADSIIQQMFNNGFFKNFALIDIISDTLMNLAMMAGIWFRIKTLKH